MSELVKFIIWSLVVFGVVNGVVFSTLLRPPVAWISSKSKFMAKLLSCPMCFGFWVGMLASFTISSPSGNFIGDAFLGSCTSWLIFLFIRDKQLSGS